MTELVNILIENEENSDKPCIRIDWSNDRHQRIEIAGKTPHDVINAFRGCLRFLESELASGEI